MEQASLPVEDSVAGMLPIIDKATKKETGGRLWDYTGQQLAW